MKTIKYDDKIVIQFALATFIWGIVGMLAGVVAASQLAHWKMNLGNAYTAFGRLRPLHTNAAIFAFAGNAIFCAVYYSMQRLLKTRMYHDVLSKIHFYGWQCIIVAAAITLPLGITTGKEYAELEWPIDLAIAVVWVVFAVNFFGTILKRREKHLYVAIWFYMASVVTITILHVVNSIEIPVSLFKSYPVYAGVQDALVQWWYGHNAVAFFLTTPFLGLMYYFVPKAANRPIYSYRLSIIHFWGLIFIYIWAGPHHLVYTALPDWAQNLGVVFSIMLIAPSWGGMINGLLTLRGAWDKLRTDPVIKFMVAAITFYGMATFEGPMLSLKSVNSLSHYTDWTVGHVHSGTLGWNGFLIFGMLYYLIPLLFRTSLYSIRLANWHFWLGMLGIVFYVVPMWFAGITQGLMWKSFNAEGFLAYPNFMETVTKMLPFYWTRLMGGLLYFCGSLLMAFNLYKTIRLGQYTSDTEVTVPDSVMPADHPDDTYHRILEGRAFKFTLLTILAVSLGGLAELLPTFLIKSNVPTLASVKPYTPLELLGRDVYIKEGCYTCHSQMIRPFRDEILRYGEYSKAGEFVYDHPFQWGSRRIGPDLHRIGRKYNDEWHFRHLEDPRSTSPGSLMPSYSHLSKTPLDWTLLEPKLKAMQRLGVPYSDQDILEAPSHAARQAQLIATHIGHADSDHLEDSEMVALIAYLQRLGTDIKPKS